MKFKNKITGCVEYVTNKELIAQYQKYTDVYEEVKSSKADSKKIRKKTK